MSDPPPTAEPKNDPEPSVSNVIHNAPVDRSKLSKYDTAAITLARLNPSMTPCAIATKLVESGLAKSTSTIYQRFAKNDYFKAEFQAVRQNIEQQMVRELAPLALKEHKKALKDKTLHARDKFPYVKLALDKTTADRKDGALDSPIRIGSVQQLQVVFSGTLDTDNTETVVQQPDMIDK
jgi:hypothetical protein